MNRKTPTVQTGTPKNGGNDERQQEALNDMTSVVYRDHAVKKIA
ncbi:hypothetical protein [Lentilactobacillus farraginis]|nr:hypothetical protein [Lentilactobacillus farraginis]